MNIVTGYVAILNEYGRKPSVVKLKTLAITNILILSNKSNGCVTPREIIKINSTTGETS